MKRKLIALSILGITTLLVGCTEDYPTYEKEDIEEVAPVKKFKPFKMNTVATPVSAEVTPEPAIPSIDTSVFEYAHKVDVTDARELNKHLTITVWMSEGASQGQAGNNVLGQAFYFIQQDDVVGADTVTIGVMVGNTRVFQFTVDVAKFTESADGSFVDDVLAASTVDKMSVEVARFADAFEWRIVK